MVLRKEVKGNNGETSTETQASSAVRGKLNTIFKMSLTYLQ
jgi:hypothetical protein